MKVSIIGSGYVGLVTAACFAHVGNDVVGLDIDENKIERLNKGMIPIYEPGLEEIIIRNRKSRRLSFTTDVKAAVEHADYIFICVGTPQSENGNADLSYVIEAAQNIGKYLVKDVIVINKSTVPVGTGNLVKQTILESAQKSGKTLGVHVISNPEFLREGSAVYDFMQPDRVVIGSDASEALSKIIELYLPFIKDETKIIQMGLTAAELTKYAANCFLATKISFINEIANLCDLVGANIDEVKKGIGMDNRIGTAFLNAGIGYGGSCFPKDVKAMIQTAKEKNYDFKILKSAEGVNEIQKNILTQKINRYYDGQLAGKTFAVWGLAFKAQTDDMREASSIPVINALLEAGCNLKVTDPAAISQAQKIWADKLVYAEDLYHVLKGADALIILTEWDEFKRPNYELIKSTLKQPVIFDGRNIYNLKFMKTRGFEYISIGRPHIHRAAGKS